MRRDDGTWLTLGLAGLGAAAAAVTAGRRGAANETEAVKVDYGRAVLTGELWIATWDLDETAHQWDEEGILFPGQRSRPFMDGYEDRPEHPYHLLAFDVQDPGEVQGTIHRRMNARLDAVSAEDLPRTLGVEPGNIIPGRRKGSRTGDYILRFSVGIQDPEALQSIVQRLIAADDQTEAAISITMPGWGVLLQDLRLMPRGPKGPKIDIGDLKVKRLLGGRWKLVRKIEG